MNDQNNQQQNNQVPVEGTGSTLTFAPGAVLNGHFAGYNGQLVGGNTYTINQATGEVNVTPLAGDQGQGDAADQH